MSCSAKAPVYAAFAAAFFPTAQRLGVSGAVRARHRDGGGCSQAALLHGTAGSSALCHGAAGLPLAGRTQRAAADAAANAGISRAGVHGHPRGEHWRVGAAHVHPGVARSRKCRREPAGRGRANDRAGVSAARLRRLARRDRARDRAAGQGDGAVHARRAARGRADGGAAAGVLPEAAASFLVFTALYAPCVAAQAAMRQELGSRPAAFAAAAGYCAAAWCTAAVVYRIAIWI